MEDERQPTRGRVREDRQFDTTQLHESQHGRLVHRDYAAHFFRWGWVQRHFRPGEYILDVGCGQDLPLARLMTNRPGSVREQYYGVDLNRISRKVNFSWATILDEFDITTRATELLEMIPDGFDHVVCFEVIEHMRKEDGRRLLKSIESVMLSDGHLYLSTPVFNGLAAANHIHEYRIPELAELIDECGLVVEKRIGTFASLPDIKPVLDEDEKKMMAKLDWWFGNEVMSVLFACNHPDQSRNNLWICRPKG